MKHPPLFILTRIILPLGLPLLTLGFTNTNLSELNRVARHLTFFGFTGTAMGLSIERSGEKSKIEEKAKNREQLTNQLRLLIAGGSTDENTSAILTQLIEDSENERFF